MATVAERPLCSIIARCASWDTHAKQQKEERSNATHRAKHTAVATLVKWLLETEEDTQIGRFRLFPGYCWSFLAIFGHFWGYFGPFWGGPRKGAITGPGN